MKKMICIDLHDHSVSQFKEILQKWDWKNVRELHLVHGFQLQTYADTFYVATYPQEDQYEEIENSVLEVLSSLADTIFKTDPRPQIIKKCIISSSPKKSLADYAKENKIDEIVIGTREKHGISGVFASSFAEYMVRYSSANLKILRF